MLIGNLNAGCFLTAEKATTISFRASGQLEHIQLAVARRLLAAHGYSSSQFEVRQGLILEVDPKELRIVMLWFGAQGWIKWTLRFSQEMWNSDIGD